MPAIPDITDEARAEAELHIREHSLGEAARIGKLSRIREVVLGAQDGLLVPLGVVTGMAAASPSQSLIIIAGLAEAFAGAVAMGSGSYLASEAEEGLYQAEIRDLYAAGCRYLQVDDTSIATLCDPSAREARRKVGDDPDQMPAIDLAERIELDQASRMHRCGKMVAGCILVLHETLQRVHQPPP